MDATHQTVTVQIAMQERVRFNGQQQWWDVPPIINVPILIPRGGGFSVTLPLKQGDQGMLIFCDTCFDSWWVNGQTAAPPAQNQPPLPGPNPSGSQRQLEVRRHHIHDCGFLPGMWSQNNLLTDYSTTSAQFRSDDTSSIIDVAGAAGTTAVTNALSSVALDGNGAFIDAPSLLLTAETGNVEVSGDLQADDNVFVGSGASGSFSTSTGLTVTVQNGIVIDIS